MTITKSMMEDKKMRINKISALLVLAIFVMSIVPALAEDGRRASHADVKATDVVISNAGAVEKEVLPGEGAGDRAVPSGIKRTQIAEKRAAPASDKTRDAGRFMNIKSEERDKFIKLKAEHADKFAKLKKEKMDRFSRLKEKDIKKFAKLEQKQIERLGEIEHKNLEKIASLKEKMIKKISGLKKEQIERLAGLEHRDIKKLTALKAEKLQKISDLDKKQMIKLAKVGRARMEKIAGLDKDSAVKEIAKLKIKKVKRADLYRKRAIAKEKMKIAEERYSLAKDEYSNARAKYRDAKEKFREVKEKISACKDQESDECKDLRAKALEHAKAQVINTAEMGIKHLTKIKGKVEGADDIDEERAASIISDVDAGIALLEDAIEKAGSAATKDEIKEAAKDVREIWKKYKVRALKHAARLVNARIGEIIVRAEQLERKLDRILERAEERGIEIEGIDEKMDEFSAKIEEARVSHKLAGEKFLQAKKLRDESDADRETIHSLIKESKKHAKDAHTALVEAHRILKGIVKEIRENRLPMDVEEEEEVEVVEEEEEIEEEPPEETGEDDGTEEETGSEDGDETGTGDTEETGDETTNSTS